MLEIHELFSSIQGESTRAGLPCFFLRLSGCNLRCSYCDTKKAWGASGRMRKSVAELVRAAKESGLRLAEVTGGEPLAQKETPELCRALLDAGFTVLVETNGSYDCSVLPEGVVRVIDWKTPSSGMSGHMFEPNFANPRPSDEFKFVISDRADFEASLAVVKKYSLTERAAVLFAPVFGKISPVKLAEMILETKLPIRMNLQLHKIIWSPDSEGV